MAEAAVGDGDWALAVDRFAAWLDEFSPYFRKMRTPVPMPDDAPARWAYFWRTVGWAPGIGVSWNPVEAPPVREVWRAEADKVFRRWLGRPCFAPAMGLPGRTPRALWDRLPARCWVLGVGLASRSDCHGGHLYYLDEDAGDDPPVMEWNTNEADHVTGPVPPVVESTSSLAFMIGCTIGPLAAERGTTADLPVPPRPSPLAPVYPYLWPLGPGVWGTVDVCGARPELPPGGGPPDRLRRVLYRSAEDYFDHLLSLPADQLAGYHGYIAGAYRFHVPDLGSLAPRRLAERGFAYADGLHQDQIAVGRLDGIRLVAHIGVRCVRSGTFHVLPEDYQAFRRIIRREKIRVDFCEPADPPYRGQEPADVVREILERKIAKAVGAVDPAPPAAGGGTPKRTRRVKPVAASDPAEEAAVRAEAAGLRRWLEAAHPGLELVPPDLAPDEPPLVRALWEELGYHDELEPVLGQPERAASQLLVSGLLAEYRDWGSPLRRKALPRRFRVVEVDEQGCGFMLTNEDGPTDDPPVLTVGSDTGEVNEALTGYVAHIGKRVAWYAGTGQVTLAVRTEPPLAGLGSQPYPRLVPDVRRLDTHVWARPDPGTTVIGAPGFGDLVTWIARTTLVDRLDLERHDGLDRVPAATVGLARFTPPPGLRHWQAPGGDAHCHAGLIDGVPVLVRTAERITLYAEHADRARAASIAAAAGWT